MSNHDESEGREGKTSEELSHRVIGFAIEVHRVLGPGLSGFSSQGCQSCELERC